MKHKLLVLLVILLTFSVFTVAAQDAPPDEVQIQHPGLFPEGIEYDAEAGHFLVRSAKAQSLRSATTAKPRR